MSKEIAFLQGAQAQNLSDNPYWKEYPQHSSKGILDELDSWAFVEGYTTALLDRRKRAERDDRLALKARALNVNPLAKGRHQECAHG